jgi:hypothetical protein
MLRSLKHYCFVLAQTHYAPLCKKVLQIKRTMSGSRRSCCLVKLEKEFGLSDESASVSEKSTASFVSSGTALWHPHVNAKSGSSSLVLLSLPLLSAFCHKLLIDSFVGDGKTFFHVSGNLKQFLSQVGVVLRSYFWHQAQVCMSLARVSDDTVLKQRYEELALEFAQNALGLVGKVDEPFSELVALRQN